MYILTEKIGTLRSDRETIIKKAAYVSTLNDIQEDYNRSEMSNEVVPPKKCKKCSSKNKNNLFFCRFCGERFSDDRKDVSGSLSEIGELNMVFNDLLAGIKLSVSFLALMKGLNTGVSKFTESVSSVKSSQDQYASLPKLKINIHEFSKSFADKIVLLEEKIDVQFFNIHPFINIIRPNGCRWITRVTRHGDIELFNCVFIDNK